MKTEYASVNGKIIPIEKYNKIHRLTGVFAKRMQETRNYRLQDLYRSYWQRAYNLI